MRDAPVARALVLSLSVALLSRVAPAQTPKTWTADNGNGTFSNPLFYDEFSDPDLIRVGDDFYLTGTTMHAMPGLPVLHSRDLVNWEFMSYALDKLDLGPRSGSRTAGDLRRRASGRRASAITTAPSTSSRNVNGQTTQHFTATIRAGHGRARAMKRSLPRSLRAVRRRRQGLRRVGLPDHALRAARQHAHRHRSGHRARAVREKTPGWARARTSTRSTASTTSRARGMPDACGSPRRAPIVPKGRTR